MERPKEALTLKLTHTDDWNGALLTPANAGLIEPFAGNAKFGLRQAFIAPALSGLSWQSVGCISPLWTQRSEPLRD
jgi:hypothetical protein